MKEKEEEKPKMSGSRHLLRSIFGGILVGFTCGFIGAGGGVMLRIKDDCVPFDPGTRKELRDPSDPAKNIGIRMIVRMTEEVFYQNNAGINTLLIRI